MIQLKKTFVLTLLLLCNFAFSSIDIQLLNDTDNPGQLKLIVDDAQKDCRLTISNRTTGKHKTYNINKNQKHQFTLSKKLSSSNNQQPQKNTDTFFDIVIDSYYGYKNFDKTFKIRVFDDASSKESFHAKKQKNKHKQRDHNYSTLEYKEKNNINKEKNHNYANQQARTVANRIAQSFGERERYDLSLSEGFNQGYKQSQRDLNDNYIWKGYKDGRDNRNSYFKQSVSSYFNKTLAKSFQSPKRFGSKEFSIHYRDHNPNSLLDIFISRGEYKIRRDILSAEFAFKEWEQNKLGGRYDKNLYQNMSMVEKIQFKYAFKHIFDHVIKEKLDNNILIRNGDAYKEGIKLGKIIKGYEIGLAESNPTWIDFTISTPLLTLVLSF